MGQSEMLLADLSKIADQVSDQAADYEKLSNEEISIISKNTAISFLFVVSRIQKSDLVTQQAINRIVEESLKHIGTTYKEFGISEEKYVQEGIQSLITGKKSTKREITILSILLIRKQVDALKIALKTELN